MIKRAHSSSDRKVANRFKGLLKYLKTLGKLNVTVDGSFWDKKCPGCCISCQNKGPVKLNRSKIIPVSTGEPPHSIELLTTLLLFH